MTKEISRTEELNKSPISIQQILSYINDVISKTEPFSKNLSLRILSRFLNFIRQQHFEVYEELFIYLFSTNRILSLPGEVIVRMLSDPKIDYPFTSYTILELINLKVVDIDLLLKISERYPPVKKNLQSVFLDFLSNIDYLRTFKPLELHKILSFYKDRAVIIYNESLLIHLFNSSSPEANKLNADVYATLILPYENISSIENMLKIDPDVKKTLLDAFSRYYQSESFEQDTMQNVVYNFEGLVNIPEFNITKINKKIIKEFLFIKKTKALFELREKLPENKSSIRNAIDEALRELIESDEPIVNPEEIFLYRDLSVFKVSESFVHQLIVSNNIEISEILKIRPELSEQIKTYIRNIFMTNKYFIPADIILKFLNFNKEFEFTEIHQNKIRQVIGEMKIGELQDIRKLNIDGIREVIDRNLDFKLDTVHKEPTNIEHIFVKGSFDLIYLETLRRSFSDQEIIESIILNIGDKRVFLHFHLFDNKLHSFAVNKIIQLYGKSSEFLIETFDEGKTGLSNLSLENAVQLFYYTREKHITKLIKNKSVVFPNIGINDFLDSYKNFRIKKGLEIAQPISDTEFNPVEDFARIKQLPKSERKTEIITFKEKLINQRLGWSYMISIIRELLELNPSLDIKILEDIVGEYEMIYKLPKSFVLGALQRIKLFEQNRTNMDQFISSNSKEAILAYFYKGLEGLGVSLDSNSPIDSNAFIERGPFAIRIYSSAILNKYNILKKFESGAFAVNLSGINFELFSDYNLTTQSTVTHENAHSFVKTLGKYFELPFDALQTVRAKSNRNFFNKISDFLTGNQNREVLSQEVEYLSRLNDANFRDEVFAYYLDGTTNINWVKSLFSNWDINYFYSKRLLNWSYININPENLEIFEQKLIDEYRIIYNNAVDAIYKLDRIMKSRSDSLLEYEVKQLVFGILYHYPLEIWPSVVQRYQR